MTSLLGAGWVGGGRSWVNEIVIKYIFYKRMCMYINLGNRHLFYFRMEVWEGNGKLDWGEPLLFFSGITFFVAMSVLTTCLKNYTS